MTVNIRLEDKTLHHVTVLDDDNASDLMEIMIEILHLEAGYIDRQELYLVHGNEVLAPKGKLQNGMELKVLTFAHIVNNPGGLLVHQPCPKGTKFDT